MNGERLRRASAYRVDPVRGTASSSAVTAQGYQHSPRSLPTDVERGGVVRRIEAEPDAGSVSLPMVVRCILLGIETAYELHERGLLQEDRIEFVRAFLESVG